MIQKIFIRGNVRAGEEVWNGFLGPGGYSVAPKDPGTYSLYELADEKNNHRGWKWVKEK